MMILETIAALIILFAIEFSNIKNLMQKTTPTFKQDISDRLISRYEEATIFMETMTNTHLNTEELELLSDALSGSVEVPEDGQEFEFNL